MPQYEYRCSRCDHTFELRRVIDQRDAAAICPQCQGEGQRLMSGFGVKLGTYMRPASTRVERVAWSAQGSQEAGKGASGEANPKKLGPQRSRSKRRKHSA